MRGAKEKAARYYNSVCQQQVEQNISIPEENKKSYFDLIPCINIKQLLENGTESLLWKPRIELYKIQNNQLDLKL